MAIDLVHEYEVCARHHGFDRALFADVRDERFYFVHSYYAAPKAPGDVVCRSTYGVPFAAAVA